MQPTLPLVIQELHVTNNRQLEVSQRQMYSERQLCQDGVFPSMKPENRRIIERAYLGVKGVIGII